MMKVGMYYSNSDVRLEETPVPEAQAGSVLIKVMACGICGSDIMEWYRIKRAPLVLGHEVTGEVVEVGPGVTAFQPGDRVFTTHHVPCNACHYCLRGHETACEMFQTKNNHTPGGFSQFLRVSGRSVETGTVKLPDEMSYEQGSFIEPVGTAVRGLRAADLHPGDSVLILGSGIVGLLIIQLARALGAGRVMATDIHPDRLQAASRFGAAHTFLADQDIPSCVREANDGRLADKVIICAGALSPCEQALQSVDKGGTVVFFAVAKPGETIPIDFNPFWRNDISFKTCYGAAPLDNAQAMELIRAGNVNVTDMITHRFNLGEIGTAFSTASQGTGCLKVLVRPND